MTLEPAQPESTEPQMLAVCTIVNRRPIDLEAYRAACAAAGDDEVVELRASAVYPEMLLWHGDRWLPVKFVERRDESVTITFTPPEPGSAAIRIAMPSAPVYRRVSPRGRPAARP